MIYYNGIRREVILLLLEGDKNYYFIRYKHTSIVSLNLYIANDIGKFEEEISTVIDIHPFEWLLIKSAQDEVMFK